MSLLHAIRSNFSCSPIVFSRFLSQIYRSQLPSSLSSPSPFLLCLCRRLHHNKFCSPSSSSSSIPSYTSLSSTTSSSPSLFVAVVGSCRRRLSLSPILYMHLLFSPSYAQEKTVTRRRPRSWRHS
jgi:hypothetical protein